MIRTQMTNLFSLRNDALSMKKALFFGLAPKDDETSSDDDAAACVVGKIFNFCNG